MNTAEATVYGAIIAGGFGIFGTLLGVALGLFGERWVRTWGEVRCDIRWSHTMSSGSVDSPGGVEVTQRQLGVTFLNRKDVPVSVWDLRVVFYKGGQPLGAEEHPSLQFSGEHGGRGTFDLVPLLPHIPVTRSVWVSVDPFTNHAKLRPLREADRIEFVAEIEGAKTKRTQLAPWNDLTPQEKRC